MQIDTTTTRNVQNPKQFLIYDIIILDNLYQLDTVKRTFFFFLI